MLLVRLRFDGGEEEVSRQEELVRCDDAMLSPMIATQPPDFVAKEQCSLKMLKDAADHSKYSPTEDRVFMHSNRKTSVGLAVLMIGLLGCKGGAKSNSEEGTNAQAPLATETIEVGLGGQAFVTRDGASLALLDEENLPATVEVETISVDEEELEGAALLKGGKKGVVLRKKTPLVANVDRNSGRYALKPAVKPQGSYVIVTVKNAKGEVERRAFLRVIGEKDSTGKVAERARNLDSVTTKVADMLEPFLQSAPVAKVDASASDADLTSMTPEEQLATLINLGVLNETELLKTAQTIDKQQKVKTRLSAEEARKIGRAAIMSNWKQFTNARSQRKGKGMSLAQLDGPAADEEALKALQNAYRLVDLKLTDKDVVSKFDKSDNADWLRLITDATKSLSANATGFEDTIASLMGSNSSSVFSLIPEDQRDADWEKFVRARPLTRRLPSCILVPTPK